MRRASTVRYALWLVIAMLMGTVLLLGAGERREPGDGEIRYDVRVGDVSLQGQTEEQARRTLEEEFGLDTITLNTESRDKEIPVEASELGVDFDAAATAGEAYEAGKEKDFLRRLGQRISASADGATEIKPQVNYDAATARRGVERATAGLVQEPRDATVSMTGIVGNPARVGVAREGYEVNAAATADNVARAARELEDEAGIVGGKSEPEIATQQAEDAADEVRTAVSEPLGLSAAGEEWTVSPHQVAGAIEVRRSGDDIEAGLEKGGLGPYLGGMYESVYRTPEDASYEIAGRTIRATASSEGRRIEDAELFAELDRGLFKGQHHYDVPVAEEEPEMTTGQAERLKPTELIGEYRTPYTETGDASAERMRNLKKSSGAVDGVAVGPGDIFSFNELAADINYEAAKVIVDGQAVTEEGGGLCQVSSTLYNAANDAGLEIVERAPHSAELPYIRPGLDATVWFGNNGTQELDMKFRNTTDSNILVRETMRDDGYVYAEIWGRPTGREVELDSERVSADENSTGWITHRTVKEDGKPVSREQVHTDTYEPLEGEEGEPIPNSEAAPADW